MKTKKKKKKGTQFCDTNKSFQLLKITVLGKWEWFSSHASCFF